MLYHEFIRFFNHYRERWLNAVENWFTQYYVGRSLREKGLLIGALLIMFCAGYYSLLWQPLNIRIEQQERELQQLNTLLKNLQTATPDIISVRQKRAAFDNLSISQISQIINTTSSIHSIVIRQIKQNGVNIQVAIEPVIFDDLLKWLSLLSKKYSLEVIQIDVISIEQKGMIKVENLVLAPY
ncbi:general secretion pathway protein [Escherichia coli]|nr:general secretion pathway protein [Escherichia coli]EFN7879975.1 general secretion pathway protein [Escherichia coli]